MHSLRIGSVHAVGTPLATLLLCALTACGGGGEDDDGGSASGGSSFSGGTSSTGGQSATGGDTSTGGADTGGTGSAGEGVIFGDPCTEETVCPMRGEFAGNCKTNWPGGYCSAGCNFFGDCGLGNVCDMGLRSCLRACDTDDECRDGYECSDEYKGCEPEL